MVRGEEVGVEGGAEVGGEGGAVVEVLGDGGVPPRVPKTVMASF